MAYRNLNQTEDFMRTAEAGLKAIPADNKKQSQLRETGLRLLHQTGTSRSEEGRLDCGREDVQRGG